jgi:SNF2 family DNA or RNA helicase
MPFTIHAAWIRADEPGSTSQLFLWAEDPDVVIKNPVGFATASADVARGSIGRQRGPKIPSHPAQVSIGQLRALLTSEPVHVPVDQLQPANARVWLPSLNGMPLTRRSVFQSNGSGHSGMVRIAETPTLTPWQVTGLALSPLAALNFLGQLSNSGSRQNGNSFHRMRLGNDLLFWSNAAKFALEILVGQYYLPSLRNDPSGRLEAVWQPLLLDARVEQRREQLVRTMPPVCRAYNLESLEDAPAPTALTEHFVATLVDAAVRTWGADLAPTPTDSPAHHWLNRLLSPQAHLHLPPQPAHDLYQEWYQWTEQLFVVRDANFRICFVLEEPEVTNGVNGDSARHLTWKLAYYLQARDNPSLMIEAKEIWQAPNNTVRVGSRHIDQPQERLLAGLGVASRMFPPIERSLRNPRPELCLLSTEEAYRFLREIGPLLESSGFGVVLPNWWHAHRRMRLGLRLRLSSSEGGVSRAIEHDGDSAPRRGGLTLNSLIDYGWELVLGGNTLSEAEFEQLTAMQTPLLRMGGRWVELEPHQVEAAKRFLNDRRATGSMTLLQAIRVAQEHSSAQENENALELALEPTPDAGEAMVLPTEIAPPGDAAQVLPLDSVIVSGWLETALDRLRHQQPLLNISEPEGFVGELRAYQRRGVGWLAHLRQLGLGACLADDMGLGKTIQAIALLLHVRNEYRREHGPDARMEPTLLICPTSVVANWRREIERFAPGLRALVHHGNNRLTGDEFVEAVRTHDLIITSYGTARRDIEILKDTVWSDLILDEAQNIKTPSAKQTQAVRRLRADNRIALTGTPVENRLSELWSIMEFLNPGYLGRQEQFRQRYIVPIERYNDTERTDELRRLVQPFLLRRLKSDPTIISDLPEKNEMVVYCSLTREQAALYEKVVQESLTELNRTDGIQRRGLVLALLTKLKQITNHPAHFLKESEPLAGRSGKLNRLGEMLEEAIDVGDRALIFTQFVEMGHLLQRYLTETLGVEALFLHGSTPAAQRDKLVQAFQSEDGPPIFVLSLRAGGSGLNLTRANHVFHYDRWWNPAVENQATDRAFRIGQMRNVQVHKFVVAGTLEERINDLIESKQALAQSIVGSGEDWITELDTDQLRDLLMLRYDAIEDE